jgi:putative transposase
MARQLRFQYAGAVYHVMARGDGGKQIFVLKEDHESFLYWLEKTCGSHGWRVHAWVLMGNHFHLLLETPEANLSAGMRVLLGTFSQAWNSRHQRRGHVFQGRYKSVPVAGEAAADAHYFKSVADYIHLNPARAGLAGGARGKLVDFPWSSLPQYGKGNPPAWLVIDRVLDAFKLSHNRRGRSAYVAWLEARASADGGRIEEAAMEALRRGWYLGKESFRDKLLGFMEKAKSGSRKKDSHAGGAVHAHNENEAERIIRAVGVALDLSTKQDDLMLMKKGDRRKVICAAVVKGRTAVGNDWLAERLAMGHGSYVSTLVHRIRRDKKELRMLNKYDRI